MNKDDLLSLFDLNGKEGQLPDTSISAPAASTSSPKSAHLTALEVDSWGLRRGRDLLAESDRLRRVVTDEYAAADFFTAAFEPDPQLRDSCSDPQRREFLAQLLDTPEYHALHASTRLDDMASSIAATHFAEEYAKLHQEETAQPEDEVGREMATLRAVGKAIAEAGREVEELHEAVAAMGMGPGMPGSNDPKAVAALFKLVRSNPALRRICELAGRFRRVAQSKQRRKVAHGLDDVVGVEPGGDVSRLLPVELAQLMVPELELDTLRRIAERQALCREHQSVEPVGKGPIIIAIDESGSMAGDKAHTAKALGLALAWIARQQKRWCALIAYSGDSGERLLALPPGRWDEHLLAEWLAAFIGCGSSIDVPVREMPEYYRRLKAPPGITDVVFVTDAQVHIPEEIRTPFLNWKKASQARLISLIIDNPPGDLAVISDEVHAVPAIAPDSDAVGRILSL